MNESCAPGRFLIPRIRLRVVWGLSQTIASFSPRSVFKSDRLPGVGTPEQRDHARAVRAHASPATRVAARERGGRGRALGSRFAAPGSRAPGLARDAHLHREAQLVVLDPAVAERVVARCRAQRGVRPLLERGLRIRQECAPGIPREPARHVAPARARVRRRDRARRSPPRIQFARIESFSAPPERSSVRPSFTSCGSASSRARSASASPRSRARRARA